MSICRCRQLLLVSRVAFPAEGSTVNSTHISQYPGPCFMGQNPRAQPRTPYWNILDPTWKRPKVSGAM